MVRFQVAVREEFWRQPAPWPTTAVVLYDAALLMAYAGTLIVPDASDADVVEAALREHPEVIQVRRLGGT